LETVQQEGTRQVKRKLEFYNLDAIISVGYRVNSSKATQFRIWATQLLKEYIIKGFAIDDDRLKNGRMIQVPKLPGTFMPMYRINFTMPSQATPPLKLSTLVLMLKNH
jgi:hypothetical protein